MHATYYNILEWGKLSNEQLYANTMIHSYASILLINEKCYSILYSKIKNVMALIYTILL